MLLGIAARPENITAEKEDIRASSAPGRQKWASSQSLSRPGAATCHCRRLNRGEIVESPYLSEYDVGNEV